MSNIDEDPRLVDVSVTMTDKHWIGKDLLIYIFPFDEDEKVEEEEES